MTNSIQYIVQVEHIPENYILTYGEYLIKQNSFKGACPNVLTVF